MARKRPRQVLPLPVPRLDLPAHRRADRLPVQPGLRGQGHDRARAFAGRGAADRLPSGVRVRQHGRGRPEPGRATRRGGRGARPAGPVVTGGRGRADRRLAQAPHQGELEAAGRERDRRLPPVSGRTTYPSWRRRDRPGRPGTRPAADRAVVYREARYADEHDYDAWEALWPDDHIYWVPAGGDPTEPGAQMSVIYDNWSRIATRLNQLRTGQRHAQSPPSGLRRVTSNIEVLDRDDRDPIAGRHL